MTVREHIELMKSYPEDCGCEHCEAARDPFWAVCFFYSSGDGLSYFGVHYDGQGDQPTACEWIVPGTITQAQE